MGTAGQHLAGTLRRELQAGREFVALLEEEHTELLASNPERLPDIAARKVALALRLGELARERGAPPAAAPLQGPLLGELVACAREARRLTQANAALLDQRLRAVGEGLAVLMQYAQGAGQIYTQDGRWHAAVPRAPRATA